MHTPQNRASMRLGVSIVVPTFNRRDSLHRFLSTLTRQTFPSDQFEVVVVDDGSTDGTADLLRTLELPFRVRVFEQQHGGPAAARNHGVRQADGELILFLDDDVVPHPELIAAHVSTHASTPNAVVIGPMSPPPADWPRPAWVRWEEEMLQIQYRALLADEYACSPRQFYTANASVARDRFLAAGGFDSSFHRAEDVELAYRLLYDGARFVFNPQADVQHYAWRSFESWSRTPYQYGRYDVVMHREKGHPQLVLATLELQNRHFLNRLLTRTCAGHARVTGLVVLGLRMGVRVADAVGAHRFTMRGLSAIFSLRYWQGICDEFGDTDPVRRPIPLEVPATSV